MRRQARFEVRHWGWSSPTRSHALDCRLLEFIVEDLKAGALITPSVRLVRPLARGGMGNVWIGEHLVLQSRVVVKMMARQFDGITEVRARFAREGAVAAAVKSPHVVQVFDSGVTDGGVPYIVMELLEGRDLAAHLRESGPLEPREGARVIAQLGQALSKAHRLGIVHRDIKPENIFLCDGDGGESFVKLLDFGAAKEDTRVPFKTIVGQLLGTPYYMSPEQMLGDDVDARADIWSLGVVAFEALTGTKPFDGATVGAITLAVHTTKPKMTELMPDLPHGVDAWFDRACAHDPADRFPTARAAADALLRAVTGEEPSPESMVESLDPRALAKKTARESLRSMRAVLATRGIGDAVITTGTYSDRVPTSLSSTLAPPRRGRDRRRATWLLFAVAGVGAVATFGVIERRGERADAAEIQVVSPPPASSPTTAATTDEPAATATPSEFAGSEEGAKAPSSAPTTNVPDGSRAVTPAPTAPRPAHAVATSTIPRSGASPASGGSTSTIPRSGAPLTPGAPSVPSVPEPVPDLPKPLLPSEIPTSDPGLAP